MLYSFINWSSVVPLLLPFNNLLEPLLMIKPNLCIHTFTHFSFWLIFSTISSHHYNLISIISQISEHTQFQIHKQQQHYIESESTAILFLVNISFGTESWHSSQYFSCWMHDMYSITLFFQDFSYYRYCIYYKVSIPTNLLILFH